MQDTQKQGFDFDHWLKLAKRDPQAFEQQRNQEVESYINSLTETATRERMERLQWRIDMERQRAKTPMEAAIRIYDMMWESVGKNFEALQSLADVLENGLADPAALTAPQAKANNVVAFKQKSAVTEA